MIVFAMGNVMRSRLVVLLLFVSTISIASCELKLSQLETAESNVNLLLDSPCEPPCWYDITPGQTTRTETLDILRELPFVDSSAIILDSAENVGWKRRSASETITGGILFSGSVVQSINIRHFAQPTSIQALIDYLGPPEGTWVSYVHLPEDGVTITMIWPQKGLRAGLEILEYEIAVDAEQMVVPEHNIKEVEYFIPFESVYTKYPEGQLRLFQEWEGLEDITLPKS
jgi:hypothetical protein